MFVEAFDLLREVIVYARKDEQSATRIALKYLEQLKTKDWVDIVNCEVTDLLKEILLNLYGDGGFSAVMKRKLQLLSEFSEIAISNSCSLWKQEYFYYQEKMVC